MTSVLHAVSGYIQATHLGHISSRGPLPVHNFTTLTTNTSTPGNGVAFLPFSFLLPAASHRTAVISQQSTQQQYRYTHTLEQHQNRFTRTRAHHHQETLGKSNAYRRRQRHFYFPVKEHPQFSFDHPILVTWAQALAFQWFSTSRLPRHHRYHLGRLQCYYCLSTVLILILIFLLFKALRCGLHI